MYRIQDRFEDSFIVNKSEFITYLQRVETEDEAKDFIEDIKKLHPKATHHCQAFIIDENIQRSNDDGEPSGTAGLPMLEILRKKNMELIAAVVVRYYGGIMLGAGGLIRAYSKGVNDALNKCDIYQVLDMMKFKVTVDYQYADQIEFLLNDLTILEKEYDMKVSFIFLSETDQLNEKILELTRGTAEIESFDAVEIEVKIKKEVLND